MSVMGISHYLRCESSKQVLLAYCCCCCCYCYCFVVVVIVVVIVVVVVVVVVVIVVVIVVAVFVIAIVILVELANQSEKIRLDRLMPLEVLPSFDVMTNDKSRMHRRMHPI